MNPKRLLKIVAEGSSSPPAIHAGSYAYPHKSSGVGFYLYTSLEMTVTVAGAIQGPDIVIAEVTYPPETYDITCIEETVNHTMELSGTKTLEWTRPTESHEKLRYAPGYEYDAEGDLTGINETTPRQFGMYEACFHEEGYTEGAYDYEGIYSARVHHTNASLEPGGVSEEIKDEFRMKVDLSGNYYSGARNGPIPPGFTEYDCTPEVDAWTDNDPQISFNPNVAIFKDSYGAVRIMTRTYAGEDTNDFPTLDFTSPCSMAGFSRAGYPDIFWDDILLEDMIDTAVWGETNTISGVITGYLDATALADGWTITTPLTITWSITIS